MKPTTDQPLYQALSSLPEAPCSAESRDRARALSLAALRDSQRDCQIPSSRGQPDGVWGLRGWLTISTACLVAAWLWLLPVHPKPQTDSLVGVIGQIEALFPNQLDSVIVSAAGVTVNASDTPRPTYADQRIHLVLSGGGSGTADVQVVTYSGRRVCVPLSGKNLCLTPLLKGDGGVMVVTETQVFEQDAAVADGYRLHVSRMMEVTL